MDPTPACPPTEGRAAEPVKEHARRIPLLSAVEQSFPVAALLTLSGGFLDGFTYIGHGRVFANAMSGNIVLMGVSAATGNWRQAWHPLPPLAAFLAGIWIAQAMRLPAVKRRLWQPTLSCLLLEILTLAAISFLPRDFPDALLVVGIALAAAMQNSSFSQLEGWTYNSVMTTGNLRRSAEAFFHAWFPVRNLEARREARVFGWITLLFFAGATLGGFCTVAWHNRALWAPVVMLAVAFALCRRRRMAAAVR